MSEYTCIDSFCGAGGLGFGLKQAGFDIRLSFDIDDTCIKTIKENEKYFDHPALVADISDMLGGKALEICHMKRGELFLLAGGPPCQGFSVQRRGSDVDPRNQRMMENIVYYSDGRIDFLGTYATRTIRNKLRHDLWYTLGLNGSVKNDGTVLADTATELVKNRKDAYVAAEAMLEVLEEDGELSAEKVEEIIADMKSKDIWDEYIGVTMFVLRQGI